MKKMADPLRVTVMDVSADTAKDNWPRLATAVKAADFIALDLELSGLGNRKALRANSVDDRYASLRETASTHSVLSVGVSCFQRKDEVEMDMKSEGCTTWSVSTFSILLLSQVSYLVEPAALKFLLRHGFDFNQQYSKGLPYTPSSVPTTKQQRRERAGLYSLTSVLALIHCLKKPLVVHNGLVDLMFFYHAFYTVLPNSMAVFLADLTELLPGGVYDTKVIAEYHLGETASYLEYLFRKSLRANTAAQEVSGARIALSLPFPATTPGVEEVVWQVPARKSSSETPTKEGICETYAYHGFCRSPDTCCLCHDVDRILDYDEARQLLKLTKKRRKRQRKSEEGSDRDEPSAKKSSDGSPGLMNLFKNEFEAAKMRLGHAEKHTECNCTTNEEDSDFVSATREVMADATPCGEVDEVMPEVPYSKVSSSQREVASLTGREGGMEQVPQLHSHRSGVDAFMTGYCFAYYCLGRGGESSDRVSDSHSKSTSWLGELEGVRNKLALSAKPIPLQICKSHFAKTSQNHRDMLQSLSSIFTQQT